MFKKIKIKITPEVGSLLGYGRTMVLMVVGGGIG
jgi:hypothetical protein